MIHFPADNGRIELFRVVNLGNALMLMLFSFGRVVYNVLAFILGVTILYAEKPSIN